MQKIRLEKNKVVVIIEDTKDLSEVDMLIIAYKTLAREVYRYETGHPIDVDRNVSDNFL